MLSSSYELTRESYERALADYGLPERIRSETGESLTALGWGGCRGSTSGGSAWELSTNGSTSGDPSRTGRTNNTKES